MCSEFSLNLIFFAEAVFLHSMSAFCRRLLIQLLLENEKVVVHVKNETKFPLKNPSGVLPLQERHPSMGMSGDDRLFYVSTHAYIYELLNAIGMRIAKSY